MLRSRAEALSTGGTMITKPICILCAAAMLLSLFLPWITTPFGQSIVPWEAFNKLDEASARRLFENAPPAVYLFLGSFAMAAIFLVMSLLNVAQKTFAVLTGLIPVGLVGWAATSAASQFSRSGLPMPQGKDLSEVLSKASEILGVGAWAWIGGAVLLLVLGVLDPGRRARKT
jgi:predicted DNA repair protein MutK